ncbi:hypothetical protein BB560_006864 [Smittium megazygosporum]|uniref:Transcription factor Iwr1 domain-containing protein n=1 Tax=Smittium megazygosporum TaxID=133381 RepID=A0A2T9Y0R0_9FUNG|nr:hypothetical protein BB560_006864 [Smittium megazygosporum]
MNHKVETDSQPILVLKFKRKRNVDPVDVLFAEPKSASSSKKTKTHSLFRKYDTVDASSIDKIDLAKRLKRSLPTKSNEETGLNAQALSKKPKIEIYDISDTLNDQLEHISDNDKDKLVVNESRFKPKPANENQLSSLAHELNTRLSLSGLGSASHTRSFGNGQSESPSDEDDYVYDLYCIADPSYEYMQHLNNKEDAVLRNRRIIKLTLNDWISHSHNTLFSHDGDSDDEYLQNNSSSDIDDYSDDSNAENHHTTDYPDEDYDCYSTETSQFSDGFEDSDEYSEYF